VSEPRTPLKIDLWLNEYVNSKEFADQLDVAIRMVENPAQRAKLLMDVMDYVTPKLKTVDLPIGGEGKVINITYVTDGSKKE
jgi:hypothetical protein